MSTSVVPALVSALVTSLTSALSTVEVIDGPYVTLPTGDYLTIGWAPGEDTPIDAVQQWASTTGNYSREEDVDIVCYLDTFTGDTDAASVLSRRNAAYALLDTIEDTLTADVTLGGVVRSSATGVHLTSHALRQEQTSAGYAVGIVFHLEASRVRI